MKYLALLLLVTLAACNSGNETQTVKVDDRYVLEIPDFLKESKDLHDSASLQYENALREFYVIVIDEPIEGFHNAILENNLQDEYPASIEGFTKLMVKDLTAALQAKALPAIKDISINGLPARQFDINGSFENLPVYWKTAYIKGKENYYQVITWTQGKNKEKYKQQMQDILNSFRETGKSVK